MADEQSGKCCRKSRITFDQLFYMYPTWTSIKVRFVLHKTTPIHTCSGSHFFTGKMPAENDNSEIEIEIAILILF